MGDLATIGRQNLSNLPGNLYLKIRNHLDVGDRNSGWRALFAVLDEPYAVLNISDFEREPSPTTSLMEKLASMGMTIEVFVDYARRAEDYAILGFFDVFIPAQITQHPLEEMHVLTGERVTIAVRAKGFPTPQHQWYKNGNLIEGATFNTLHIESASMSDSAVYCCAVSNSNDLTLLRFSTPTEVIVQPAPELEVKEHPQSCIVGLGGTALFKCEVWGGDSLQYQWFRDDMRLTDGEHIQGSRSREMKLYKIDSPGCYRCVISQGDQEVKTNFAVLQILDQIRDHRALTNFVATDKVALLIGCSDYRGDSILKAPKYDVQTLAGIFQSLRFKVVSMLDLTLVEMVAAIHEFRKLVGRGVYCVFYFGGHGFEANSQCFLVPTDAPLGYTHTSCVSADKIFTSLLRRKPQICCMILDICRRPKEDTSRPGLVERRDVMKDGNAIICYGTSHGLAAYEDQNFGILVSNLKKVLHLPTDCDTVFKNLRAEIHKDPRVNKEGSKEDYKQIPEIRSNLLEVHRSFTDPIDWKGHTVEFEQRMLTWENAHRKPEPILHEVEFPGVTVKVRLDFQQEFSNVLKIYTSVVECDPPAKCQAYISAVPTDIAHKAKIKTISPVNGNHISRNYIVINNIQKLKSNMDVNVTVECEAQERLAREVKINLGLPLVAALKLWEKTEDLCLDLDQDERD